MIDLELLRKARSKGLSYNELFVMYLINLNMLEEELIIEDTITNLQFLGYLTLCKKITPKGQELLKSLGQTIETGKNTSNFDFKGLFSSLQNLLKELTGKQQKVLGGKYSFLPNYTDFESKLSKVVKKYKLTDFNRVSLCLQDYIRKCNKEDWKYSMLLGYYIEKNGNSSLATDYQSFTEKEEESNFKSQQKFV